MLSEETIKPVKKQLEFLLLCDKEFKASKSSGSNFEEDQLDLSIRKLREFIHKSEIFTESVLDSDIKEDD